MKKRAVSVLAVTIINLLVISSIGFCQPQPAEMKIMVKAEIVITDRNNSANNKALFRSDISTLNGYQAQIDVLNDSNPTKGISLFVTPKIQNEDTFALQVKAKISELQEIEKEISVTEVLCKNGDTILLGGSIQNSNNDLVIRITPTVKQ